jgi:hypothetical protein
MALNYLPHNRTGGFHLDNTAVLNSYKQGFLIWLVSKTKVNLVNFSVLLLRVELLLLRFLLVFLGFAALPLESLYVVG